MNRYAIIVAGGKGLRMGGPTPKQFLPFKGRPVIAWTLERFLTFDSTIQLIVVLPENHKETWQGIQKTYFPTAAIRIATGGAERFDSVKAGLALIQDPSGLVAVHDAVRPFVSEETLSQSFQSAATYGSGVASIPLKDSIRELVSDGSKARDRSHFRLMQTPQTFRVGELQEAYRKATHNAFTDDATVYEAAGYRVRLVEGSFENIKITTPEDLKKKPRF